MKIVNALKHIKLVFKHKWIVFKLCCKIGIPWRGFMHDWSKFSPTELFESIKYYDGHKSPVRICREINGYSEAWLHHKGRNKHHPEYWVLNSIPQKAILMPYKYAAEMVCDKMAAGIVYKGKDWTLDTQLEYYKKERQESILHPQIDMFMLATFLEVSKNGLKDTFTKKNIKELYEKYCIRMEKLDENKI